MNITIHQIYYSRLTQNKLIGGFVPHYNKHCSVFFEGDVIRNCIKEGNHKDTDYFGVVGPKFSSKVKPALRYYAYVIEFINKHKGADLISLMTAPYHEDPLTYADREHPGFNDILYSALSEINFEFERKPVKYTPQCNFFVATPEFWDHYTSELMFPFMECIEKRDNSDLSGKVWGKCRYYTLPQHLKKQWGFDHYTFHPFLVERLPSIFLMKYSDRYKSIGH